jgi:hypothetical protein
MSGTSKNQPTFQIHHVGNINTGNVTIHGDQVGIQNNYAVEASVLEASQAVMDLLNNLHQKYPNATDAELLNILTRGFESMLQNNPQKWQHWKDLFSILFAGGVESIKIVQPLVGIPIEVFKQLYEIYDRNRKQLPDL